MNRKQRRVAASAARKSKNKDLDEKLSLATSLADKCRICESSFDNTNMSMLSEWMVVVREDMRETHLYCPTCWEMGQKMIKDLEEANKEGDDKK